MRGNVQGDPLGALEDVRHLARLLLSTENVQLALAGLSIFDHEREAYQYYVEEKGLAPSAWEPISAASTQRAYRAVMATRGYLRVYTEPEKLETIFLKERRPIGFCAAANEAFPFEYALRPMLDPQFPMEFDFTEGYRKLDQIYDRAKRSCRLKYLSTLVEAEQFSTDIPAPALYYKLPYSRRVFGVKYLSAKSTEFEAYNRLAARQSRPSENM